MRPLRFGLLVSLTLVGSVAAIGLAEARGGHGGARGGVRVGVSGGFVGYARRGSVGSAFFRRGAFPRGPGFGPGYGAGPGSIGFGPGYGNSVQGFRGRWDRGYDHGRGRDFGGDGYGSYGYGSYGGVYGAPGYPGGVYGRRSVPTLAGIPPTTVRPPAFYRIGAGSPHGGPYGGRARIGGGPLVADSASAGAPSGVVGSGPQIIQLR